MSNKSKLSAWVIILPFLAFVGVLNSFFIVQQTEQVMVLRFGKPVRIVQTPGLKFKVPFVDEARSFDKRTLMFHGDKMTVILADKDRLIVDAFVTYKITNPLQFYQAVRTEGTMNMRLESILEKSLRDVMGRETLATLLSHKRSDIMHSIRDRVYNLAKGTEGESAGAVAPEEATEKLVVESESGKEEVIAVTKNGFGVEVIDVRIMRTDLPPETSAAIYNRMRSDRQKVAEKFRAEGKKESQIIRSDADKTRTILLSEAEKKSETIRGEGDGTASRIFAESFGKDKEFFDFYRSMQAYRSSLSPDDTTLILSPDNSFLKYFKK